MPAIVNTGSFGLSLKNEHIVYENEIRCIVKESDYNLTYNPTILKYGGQYITSGSSGYTLTGSLDYTIKDFAQGVKNDTTYKRLVELKSFASISGSGGVDIGNHGDDVVTTGIPIGFDFEYYGVTYNSCSLSSNGNLQFNSTENGSNGYDNIPTTNLYTFGPTLFPWWGDLNTTILSGGEGIFTQIVGTPGSRIFIAEWKCYYYGGFTPHAVNFQIRLYEGTNVIEFTYGILVYDNGYVTVGIQKNTDSVGYSDEYLMVSSGADNTDVPVGTMISYIPVTQSLINFTPYVTTIGLYNDDNELLMVAKLGKPIMISPDTDMTFIVRYDT
jgi:hypothetical protein